MNLFEVVDSLMSITKGRDSAREESLLSIMSNSDYSVKDMQTEFCRTLRLNVITRNDLKIKISKILIDKINSKNNKAEFYNPKVAMKSKVRSFEELLEVVSGSIYEEMLR